MNEHDASKLSDNFRHAFDKIGQSAATQMPPSTVNMEPVAYEMHISTKLLQWAEARRKQAMDAAVEAGVIPDVKNKPLHPGATYDVFPQGQVVGITCTVRHGAEVVDVNELKRILVDKGVGVELVAECVRLATKKQRDPHVFTTMLRVEQTPMQTLDQAQPTSAKRPPRKSSRKEQKAA